MAEKGKLKTSPLVNMIHVLVLLHLVICSSGLIRSAYFKKYELKSTSSKNKEPTSGVKVQGILECARHTLSTQQTGFYYSKKDKTCRLDMDGQLAEVSNNEEYWSSAPKQNENKTNKAMPRVYKRKTDREKTLPDIMERAVKEIISNGNKNIYRILYQTSYDLRIDLEDFAGNSRYAVYKDFYLEREVNDFRLSIGQYSGTAADGLSSHYGQPYPTWDRDLDSASGNCAQSFHGVWWYFDCYRSNLNGGYLHGNHSANPSGVSWYPWRGMYYSLKSTVMKIRPSPVMAYSNWDVRR
ncbi:uncharacterized protein LOC121385988 [Gigantopelta aegis]|uniref:uncharacterized protein LOC121385988 n=1 Tax=Gigantopelta aegis TaxID=1735272 RepID=UPI001B88A584|nr:uncharacterized protein LOC121385988 [Gigantopelta aegis]